MRNHTLELQHGRWVDLGNFNFMWLPGMCEMGGTTCSVCEERRKVRRRAR